MPGPSCGDELRLSPALFRRGDADLIATLESTDVASVGEVLPELGFVWECWRLMQGGVTVPLVAVLKGARFSVLAAMIWSSGC